MLVHEADVLTEILKHAATTSYGYFFPTLCESFPVRDGLQKRINVFTADPGLLHAGAGPRAVPGAWTAGTWPGSSSGSSRPWGSPTVAGSSTGPCCRATSWSTPRGTASSWSGGVNRSGTGRSSGTGSAKPPRLVSDGSDAQDPGVFIDRHLHGREVHGLPRGWRSHLGPIARCRPARTRQDLPCLLVGRSQDAARRRLGSSTTSSTKSSKPCTGLRSSWNC